MRILNLLVLCTVADAAVVSLTTGEPTTTDVHPTLEKRYQKVRLPTTTATTTTTETPKPWVRTIYSDKVEIVTPTVIQGVTFSAKPPANTDYPQPWVSLNKYGSPKTIKPEVKNGKTKNASPTYSTYFQTATTHTYNYGELQAHNMKPDEIHEEVEFIDEDKTYVSLNPIIRCTPERYSKQGLARDTDTAPFCSPNPGVELAMGKTYFITWYTRHFSDEVKKVRLHFSYVKEDVKAKGMKRDVDHAFFTTEWVDNLHGLYPFEIDEEWLMGDYYRSVAMTIQPDNVSDDEHHLLTNATIFKIAKGSKVIKKTKQQKAAEDEGITDDSAYYIIMSIPSVIVVTAMGMYFFLYLTRNDRDISETRQKVWKSQHKILGKFRPKKNNKKYSELPQYDKGSKTA